VSAPVDVSYPELLQQAGRNHVDVLFAPTHDILPWAATDAAEARYRAIENGFVLVRATGNGPSLMVDPQGRIVAEQDYFTSQTGIMLASVPTHGVTTVYGRIGDVFAYMGVLGLLTLAARSLLGRGQPMTAVQRQPV